MFSIEGLVADILLVIFVGVFAYNGISKGFLNTTFTLVTAILCIVFALAFAFGLPFVEYAFLKFGWISSFGDGLRGFAQDFMGVVKLINIDLEETFVSLGIEGLLGINVAEMGATKVLADFLAILIGGLALFIPFYIFFLWLGRQFERFVRFVRAKCLFFRILGSVIGGVIHIGFAAAVVLGLYWLFGALSEVGLFANTYEAIKSGYITGLVCKFNPLNDLLPTDWVYGIADILKGNF